MKKLFGKIGIYLAITGIAVSFINCGGDSEAEKQGKSKEIKKVSVEVTDAVPVRFVDFIEAVGTVKPIAKANVTFAEGGIIEKIEKDKGSFVKKDEVLFVMDNEILKANMDAAKAQFDLAQMTFEKQEEIYKDNVNSEYQYLQSKYSRDQAKAAYELAKTRYEKSFVKSPIDGYVDSRNFEEGEMVAPGMTVMTVINNSKVKIVAGIPERYVGELKVGQNAQIDFPELKGKSFTGKVTFVSNSVTTTNRTFNIEIVLDNPGRLIKPEMIANVKVERKVYDGVFTIPDDALIRTDDNYVLFVAKDGKAVKRVAGIITRFGDKVAINKGLNAGEKLIVVGQQNLLDGTDIQIVN